jgi:hypothetical protein
MLLAVAKRMSCGMTLVYFGLLLVEHCWMKNSWRLCSIYMTIISSPILYHCTESLFSHKFQHFSCNILISLIGISWSISIFLIHQQQRNINKFSSNFHHDGHHTFQLLCPYGWYRDVFPIARSTTSIKCCEDPCGTYGVYLRRQ